jgi:hypothetical protein
MAQSPSFRRLIYPRSLAGGLTVLQHERRTRRQTLIDEFLLEYAVSVDRLAASTRKGLDDWARQTALVEDQPSANRADVILNICKAVESQIKVTLEPHRGLVFLGTNSALGTKANQLSDVIRRSYGQRAAVLLELQKKLRALANLRNPPAHGPKSVASMTEQQAKQARSVAGVFLNWLQTTDFHKALQ